MIETRRHPPHPITGDVVVEAYTVPVPGEPLIYQVLCPYIEIEGTDKEPVLQKYEARAKRMLQEVIDNGTSGLWARHLAVSAPV